MRDYKRLGGGRSRHTFYTNDLYGQNSTVSGVATSVILMCGFKNTSSAAKPEFTHDVYFKKIESSEFV